MSWIFPRKNLKFSIVCWPAGSPNRPSSRKATATLVGLLALLCPAARPVARLPAISAITSSGLLIGRLVYDEDFDFRCTKYRIFFPAGPAGYLSNRETYAAGSSRFLRYRTKKNLE